MPTILVTSREGDERVVETAADNSPTLMEAIRNDGSFDLVAMCGGMLSCSTCHVYVDPAWLHRLGPQTSDEEVLISASAHLKSNSRLSCQITVGAEIDGVRVTVAPQD